MCWALLSRFTAPCLPRQTCYPILEALSPSVPSALGQYWRYLSPWLHLWYHLPVPAKGVNLNSCIYVSADLCIWPKITGLMWRLAQAQSNRFIYPKAQGHNLNISSPTFQPRQLDLTSLFSCPYLIHERNWGWLRMERDCDQKSR